MGMMVEERRWGLNVEQNDRKKGNNTPIKSQTKYPRASYVATTGMSNQTGADAPTKVGLDDNRGLN